MFYQGAHTVYVVAHLIHSWTEHGSLYLHHIGEARQDRVHADRVLIADMERAHVELIHIIYRIFLSCLSYHSHRLGVSISCKASRIFQHRAYALVLLHLIPHRTFHLSGYVHEAVIRTDNDNIIVCKTHITGKLSIEHIVVDVHNRYKAVVSIYLYITQRSEVVRSASHIQGMEHSGKCRQGVCSRCLHLSHHIYHDRTGLTHRKLYLRAAVSRTKGRTKLCVCLADS